MPVVHVLLARTSNIRQFVVLDPRSRVAGRTRVNRVGVLVFSAVVAVLLSALIMTDQYTYLKYLTHERLGELCKLNFIDVSELKTKEDRVAALSTLKVVNDPAFAKPSAASLSSVGSPAAAVAKSLHVSSESDDLECYLSAFERLGRHHNLPSNEWNIVLEPFLTGKAQRAFNLVHDFNKDNYDVVSTAIRNAYRLTPEAYRSKFRASHKLTTETFTEYADRLTLYLRRWLMPDNISHQHEILPAYSGQDSG